MHRQKTEVHDSPSSSFLAAVSNAHINLSKSTAFHPSGTSIRVLVSHTRHKYTHTHIHKSDTSTRVYENTSIKHTEHTSYCNRQLCHRMQHRLSLSSVMIAALPIPNSLRQPQSHVCYAFFITQFHVIHGDLSSLIIKETDLETAAGRESTV